MKVQITVDDDLWRRAKSAAALRGESLGELVGEAIGKFVVGSNKPGGRPEPENDVRVVRDNVGSRPTPGTSPVEQKHVSVEFKTCLKCKGQVAVADAERTRDGKYLCRDCADDLRIANA